MLGTAEMRSMGEVVIELDKVSKARDEFSAEVATLSEQLEQEKTKVSQLQDKVSGPVLVGVTPSRYGVFNPGIVA